ncbi:hypothetical protein [Streptomyces sp. PR69]|uniref:hypothetical protein n=1 Tax=Streptomyces sp. PR69 TaxID=2984950 RepID=UPI00226562ED|nr:hypothetical protein [Streptomyces sp. PR69]
MADVSVMDDLQRILGPSPFGETRSIERACRSLCVDLSRDDGEILGLYGDLLISDFLFLYGPRFAVEKGVWMSEFLRDGHPIIPSAVLPDRGGMFLFGHTIEGDKLFLRQSGGDWLVSAFRRNWADWCDFDMPMPEWLVGVFKGDVATDWMPEWPERHWFE